MSYTQYKHSTLHTACMMSMGWDVSTPSTFVTRVNISIWLNRSVASPEATTTGVECFGSWKQILIRISTLNHEVYGSLWNNCCLKYDKPNIFLFVRVASFNIRFKIKTGTSAMIMSTLSIARLYLYQHDTIAYLVHDKPFFHRLTKQQRQQQQSTVTFLSCENQHKKHLHKFELLMKILNFCHVTKTGNYCQREAAVIIVQILQKQRNIIHVLSMWINKLNYTAGSTQSH